MKITFEKSGIRNAKADAYLFLCHEDKKLFSEELKQIEKLFKFKISKVSLEDFKGKERQIVIIYTGSARIILSGLGLNNKLTLEKIRRAAARGVRMCKSPQIRTIAVEVLGNTNFNQEDVARAQTISSILALYKFDKYFTKRENKELYKVGKIIFFAQTEAARKNAKEIERGVKTGAIMGNSTNVARDLGNEPSNIIYPETLAQYTSDRAAERKYSFEAFDKKKLAQLGMRGILSVGKGSTHDPRLIILKYSGTDESEAPYVIVGKGVTFDSGGISLKPAGGMAMMKMDMGGASAVVGIFEAVSQLKLKINLVGLIPSVENMPGGSSYKPGDVITAYNGLTIEVDNTDAEGRIILADALAYAAEFKPKAVIDMATLTGAAVVAIGNVASIIMGNDESLIHKLEEAGHQTFDRVWQLPLWDEYDTMIDSDIADVRNTGNSRQAGTIMGGMFLKRFIGKYPWAHVDIAATAIRDSKSDYDPKNATGAGVRLVTQFLVNESKAETSSD